LHLACSMGNNEIINILLDNAECDFRLKNLNEETCLDLLWMAMLKEPKYLSLELINRFIMQGALFSAPWNFTFAPHCHVPFVKLMSTACKYRLKDLFISFFGWKYCKCFQSVSIWYSYLFVVLIVKYIYFIINTHMK